MATSMGVRELRTHLSEALRRVEAGEEITVSVSGRPVARLTPVPDLGWTPRHVVVELLRTSQADPGLRADLHRLAGDDLEPLR